MKRTETAVGLGMLVVLVAATALFVSAYIKSNRAYSDQACSVTNESGHCPTLQEVIKGAVND